MTMPFLVTRYIWVFAIALALSYGGTMLAAALGRRLGILDHPGGRKTHARPVPRIGGAAMYVAYCVAVIYSCSHGGPQRGVLLGGLLPLAIGLVDDIRRVPALIKLAALVAASLVLVHSGVVLTMTGWYVGDVLLTVVWIVSVTSAFNALDNMDGLAAGVAMLAACTYFVISLRTFEHAWGVMALALAGATLGFLRFNFKPASIFMGDSGSFFLGFTLAAMAVMGEWSTSRLKAMAIPVLILGVPLADLAYVIVVRQRRQITQTLKEIVTFCGRDHFSHRLVDLGLGERGAVLFVYLVCACVGLAAVAVRFARALDAVLLLAQFLMMMTVIAILMRLARRHLPGRGARDV